MRYLHSHDGEIACVVGTRDPVVFTVDTVVNDVQMPEIHSPIALVVNVH